MDWNTEAEGRFEVLCKHLGLDAAQQAKARESVEEAARGAGVGAVYNYDVTRGMKAYLFRLREGIAA